MFTHQVGRKRRRRTLQQVIHDDLSILACQFAAQLGQISNLTAVGASFQLFLRIFQEGNIALIHTQGLPARCDPECFAQILYASSLALLDNLNDLPRAAFGIFSLYAFFQSSPLPVLTSTWQWTSMGLVHPDNPKLGYRRRFRQRIRIHRKEYVWIQQLRHICLGQKEDFVLATDVLEVLHRLDFEWSEYNGPRGADALAAGILDDCFIRDLPSWRHDAEDEATPEEQDWTQSTLDALNHYCDKLKAIEVSTNSQQAKRVRAALQPLAGDDSWQDLIGMFTGRSLQEAAPEQHIAVIDLPGRADATSLSPTDEIVTPICYRIRMPPSITESLQKDITSAIKHLLQRGDTLVLPQNQGRDETEVEKLVSISATTKKDNFGRHDNFLTVQDEVQPHFDSDISDVSDEEIHYALNTVGEYSDGDDGIDESAAGLGALNILLHEANKPTAKLNSSNRRKAPTGDFMSTSDSSVGRKALLSLLQQAMKGKNRKEDIDKKTNRPQQINNCHEERSVAESSVGRQALSSLLKHANTDTNMIPMKSSLRKVSQNAVASRTSPRHVNRKKRPTDANESEDDAVSITAFSDRPDAVSLSRDQGDQETSVAASSVGRQALSSLLKHGNADVNMPRRKSRRRTVSSRKAPQDVRSKKNSKSANESGDDAVRIATFSDRSDASSLSGDKGDRETSVAASSVARQALSSLLKHGNADANMPRRKPRRRAIASRKAPQDVRSKKRSKNANGSEDDAVQIGTFSDRNDASSLSADKGDQETSVAASSVGRQALSSLLKHAKAHASMTPAKPRRRTVASRKAPQDVRSKKRSKNADGSEDDAVQIGTFSDRNDALSLSGDQGGQETSVAASSVGHQALSSLLKHANAHINMSRRKSRRHSVSENIVASRRVPQDDRRKKHPKDPNESEDDGVSIAASSIGQGGEGASVAASSVGRQASTSLLKRVNKRR